jgi:hypothetical protein
MIESSRFSDLMLERYHLGEVHPGEAAAIEAALKEDRETAERLAAIRRSDAEIRNRREPWAAFSGRRMPAHRGRPGLRRFARPACAAACAAALLCALTLPFLLNREKDTLTDRVKGSVELSVFLKTDNSLLREQAVLYEGDTIQLAYRVDRPCYGVIFSIDGRSAVTLHYPSTVSGSTSLIPGRRIPLDEAYTLDDAPDCEIFFLVISDKPVDTKAVLDRAGQLARRIPNRSRTATPWMGPEVFAGYEIKTVFLKKGARD